MVRTLCTPWLILYVIFFLLLFNSTTAIRILITDNFQTFLKLYFNRTRLGAHNKSNMCSDYFLGPTLDFLPSKILLYEK